MEKKTDRRVRKTKTASAWTSRLMKKKKYRTDYRKRTCR